ncbi:ParB/RepB/Spo0J family partition protein [Caproiciproducens galactitolivorans]|nr:ParB/RepB/Spo0J family partition protein [Caproiciproducens galactitolivorans]
MLSLLKRDEQGAVILHLFNESCKVVQIPINSIHPNPAQPRKVFSEQELLELSRSIRTNGLLQPITVRRVKDGYELIAGERRLRACKIAGLTTVGCIINDCSPETSAVLAMTENLQRQDLQIFEEAEGIRQLIEQWNVTQEEAALRLGKSQSTLANKLRLLKLTKEEREKITENGLTERHARALLRIKDEVLRKNALNLIIARDCNVKQAEELIDNFLQGNEKPKKTKRTVVVKDVRIFLNTINHAIETMRQSGINAQTLKSETDEYIECLVRIPKAQATSGGKKPA